MELAAPITIYWDDPPADIRLVEAICLDIIQCRPLMLQLCCADLQETPILAILEKLKDSGIAVSLSVPATNLSDAKVKLLHGAKLKELLLLIDGVGAFPAGIAGLFAGLPIVLGVAFQVTQQNWRALPEVVTMCRREGINRLVLPMQRLYHNETPFYIGRTEQDQLSQAIQSVGGADGLNMTIHDPFMWRAFNPGTPFPQAGCQAANTMLAIASDGAVYPCPTLPVRIGQIGQQSLKEIIASPLKKQIRRHILTPPIDCAGCAELDECKGGCRGRGYRLHGCWDGLDSACK